MHVMMLLTERKFIILLQDMRALLDDGGKLPLPDGILINGVGPNQAKFEFEPGEFACYA